MVNRLNMNKQEWKLILSILSNVSLSNLKIVIYVYNNMLRGVTERLEPKNLKNV